MQLDDRMPRLSPRLASLCDLLDGRKEACWSGPETGLVTLARRHRVEPLLYVLLAAATGGWRPAKETMDTLAQDYRKNTERILRSIAWLQQLTQALAAEGIEARPLKGLPLAAQAHERIADRHCGDLDFLIGSNRLRDRTDLVVRALGLRPHFELTKAPLRLHRALYKDDGYVLPDGLRVELHYHRDGIGQLVFPDFLVFGSQAWQACSVGPVVTHRLYGTPLLLYLLSHGARSRWHRLKWLLDIRRLTHDFDADAWIELRNAAKKENLELQARIGLQLLNGAFDVPSLSTLQSGSGLHGLGFALRQCQIDLNDESDSPDSPVPLRTVMRRKLYDLLVQRNWRARLTVAGKTFICIPDIARWKLPMPLILILAPIARTFSLVYRHILRPALRRLFH